MEEFKQAISDIDPKDIVYIDETGIDKYYCREHCYAKIGETVIGRVSGRKFKRKSIVSGLQDGGTVSPLMYDGTMDSKLFEQWFDTCLIPDTCENAVFVMDNATFHRKKKLQAICEKYNRKLIFLPPYSPDLNPIEKVWANIKKKLRGIVDQFTTIEDAICFIFKSI